MLIGLHWIYLVIFGAAMNAAVNLGFKHISGTNTPFFLSACIYFIMGLTMLGFAYFHKQINPAVLLSGKLSLIVVLTGVGLATSIYAFVTALDKGPFSLVNASWLGGMIAISVITGVLLFKDQINLQSGIGVVLAILGIVFMAKA